MAFNKTIQNIIGGISQEPYNLRDDSNVEFQLNCLSSLTRGLARRDGNYYIDSVQLTSNDLLNVNTIKYKDGFIIVDANKGVYFVKKNGTKYNTVFESPETQNNFNNYLSGTPDLGFLNLNDLTYIYNKNKKVNTKVNESEEYYPIDGTKKCIAFLNNIEKSKKYSIDIDYSFVGDNVDIPISWAYALGNGTIINTDLSNSKNIKGYTEYVVDEDNLTTEQFFHNLFSRYGKYESKDEYAKKSVITTSNIPSLTWNGEPDNLKILYLDTVSTTHTVTVFGEYYDEDTKTFKEGSDTQTYTGSRSGQIDFGTKKFRKIYEIYSDVAIPVNFYMLQRTGGKVLMALKNGYKNNFIHIKPTFIQNSLILEGYKPKYYNGDFEVVFNNVNIGDERNNENFLKITNEKYTTIEDITKLPKFFFANSIVEVIADGIETFFVFIPNSDTFNLDEPTNGNWVEYKDPNIPILDYSTMPFSIIIDDNNERITIYDGGFKNRQVGNKETNRDPYFIGREIKDMFVYGGRLAILSGGDKIDLSGTNDFYNFYRTTTLDNILSDRISLSITSDKLINITKAIPFNQNVLLIDDDTQFIMSYQGALSLNTLQTQEISNFNTKSKLKPIRTNDSLFFVSDYGNNTQVVKFNSRDIQLVQGEDVTEKIQSLIPNSITSSCVNNSNDTLFIHNKYSNIFYSYQYKMFQNQGEYGAWGVHSFENYDILFIECINDELYLFCRDENDSSSIKLFKQNLTKDKTYENNFENEKCKIHLDKKVIKRIKDDPLNIDINGNQKQYLIVNYDIPYNMIDPEKVNVISTGYNGSSFKYGYSFRILDITENIITGGTKITFENPFFNKSINDDKYKVDEVLVGEGFESYTKLSKLNLVNRQGISMNSGQTQLLSLSLNFGDTGGFKVGTDIINSDYYEEIFTGKYVGSPKTLIGEMSLQSGTNVFYIGAEKNEVDIYIKNISYLPFEIQSGEYEVEYDSITSGF